MAKRTSSQILLDEYLATDSSAGFILAELRVVDRRLDSLDEAWYGRDTDEVIKDADALKAVEETRGLLIERRIALIEMARSIVLEVE